MRKQVKFSGFLAFKFVHDVSIYGERKRGRRMPYKLLTDVYIDSAFCTSGYKRMAKIVCYFVKRFLIGFNKNY